MRLSGNVAIVTGAGRGIGREIARVLGREGASVVVHHLAHPSEAAELCQAIEASGSRATSVGGDLRDATVRANLIAAALTAFGRLDILINNAAHDPGPADFFSVTEADYDAITDVNVKALFFCCQVAAARMGPGGRIINISSVHGDQTLPRRTVYAASKGAVNAMTRQLALDLSPLGITVNAIAPGLIEVERVTDDPEYNRDRLAAMIPARRVGTPWDVASLCVFLASDESSFLTGQVITLDGGTRCRLHLT